MGIFFLVIGILAVLLLIAYCCYRIYVGYASEKILRGNRKQKHFLSALLTARFGKKYVLSDLSLLGGGKGTDQRYYVTSEVILINAGGLFVIRSVPGNGLIDLSGEETWFRLLNDQSNPFPNPFEQNEIFVRLLKSLFRYEKIPNVPIYNIVVFTGNRVKFNQKMNGLLQVNHLIPYLCDMKKNSFLKLTERQRILRALQKHGKVLGEKKN